MFNFTEFRKEEYLCQIMYEAEVGRVRPSRIIMQAGGNDLDFKDVKGDSKVSYRIS